MPDDTIPCDEAAFVSMPVLLSGTTNARTREDLANNPVPCLLCGDDFTIPEEEEGKLYRIQQS